MATKNMNKSFDATGKLLEKLISDYSLNISGFAEEIGVSKVSVSQWIKGKQISIKNICQIADYFQISVKELLDGKLHDEGTADFINRNYNISAFNLNKLIKEQDTEALKHYFCKVISIKNMFESYLAKWCVNALNEDQKIEFDYLWKYARFNTAFFGDKYHFDLRAIEKDKEDLSLKKCVREFFDSIRHLDPTEDMDERNWEISKIVQYSFDLRTKDIVELGDPDLIDYLFIVLDQQQKDELLALNLQGKKKQDLEDNEALGAMVIGGANCIYRFYHANAYTDEEMLGYFEGEIIEDKEWSEAGDNCEIPGFNFAGRSQIYSYKDELKEYSYAEYRKSVMKKRTNYICDLCTLKHQLPRKYYENLKNGEYDDYID